MTKRLLLLAVAAAALACAGTKSYVGDPAREVRLNMAGQLADRGDWKKAFEVSDALCRENPGDPRVLLVRGAALRHLGMRAEAEADIQRALSIEPKWASLHAELGVLYQQERRPQEAMAEFQRALDLAPDRAEYMNDLAFALLLAGKPKEAVPLLQEALKIEPANARIRNNLGFALARLGDFPGAAQQFALAGTAAAAKNNLGFAYEQSGNLSQAYEAYLAAVRLDPAAAAPRRNLEHVAAKLGRNIPPDVAQAPAPATQGGS